MLNASFSVHNKLSNPGFEVIAKELGIVLLKCLLNLAQSVQFGFYLFRIFSIIGFYMECYTSDVNILVVAFQFLMRSRSRISFLLDLTKVGSFPLFSVIKLKVKR